ncbi:MAG: matrixin family metalloprotease [Pseudomonadota bacterium]
MKKYFFFIIVAGLNLALLTHSIAFTVILNDGKELKWQENEVTYEINENVFSKCSGTNVNKTDSINALKNSMNTWAQVPGTDVQAYYLGLTDRSNSDNDGHNVIEAVSDGWQNLDFHPSEHALAVTVSSFKNDEILDSDIHINCEYFDWSVVDSDSDSYTSKIDIQNIITHEAGHFYGLDHNSESPDASSLERAATMYYAASPGATNARSLEDDDMNGILHLYPSIDPIEPILEGISPSSGTNTGTISLSSITGSKFKETSSIRLIKDGSEDDAIVVRNIRIDSDGQTMSGEADLRGAKEGEYHVIVANSAGIEDKLEKAFKVFDSGGGNYYGSSSGSGWSVSDGSGCAYINSNPDTIDLMMMILLICPMILWGRRRQIWAKVLVKRTRAQGNKGTRG